jgi:hypothetical protein
MKVMMISMIITVDDNVEPFVVIVCKSCIGDIVALFVQMRMQSSVYWHKENTRRDEKVAENQTPKTSMTIASVELGGIFEATPPLIVVLMKLWRSVFLKSTIHIPLLLFTDEMMTNMSSQYS